MIVALIDNGSLEPAAHRNLRLVAAEISARAGMPVHAVSWKHSDRIAPDSLGGVRAWTVDAFVRSMAGLGHRDFVFIPFFISGQGAIASALRRDLDAVAAEISVPLSMRFTASLAEREALAPIVADRVREIISAQRLNRPAVVVVDHGGPSPSSAVLRNKITAKVAALLGDSVAHVAAASLEGDEYAHNFPLLNVQLSTPGTDRGEVVIAPLFLAPGRHAGARGDLARIASAAEDRVAATPLRCHFTGLIGTHARVIDELAAALDATLREPSSLSLLQPETLA